jgi:hypothetical protein
LISYILSYPLPGSWNLGLIGVDVPGGLTDYNAILSTRAGTIPSPTPTEVVVQEIPADKGGVALFLVLLVIFAAGMGIFVYNQTLKNKRAKDVIVRSMGAKIRIEKGEHRGQIINIKDGFVIGRGSLCDLKLNDTSVSRKHAILRFSQGSWYIQDLGSMSGTFINGKRVDGSKLLPRDQVTIGKNIFTFLSE